MSNSNNQVSYGFTQALISDAQKPIVAQRNPTTADKAQIGALWINEVGNNGFVLTSIVKNSASWEALGGAGGAITFDTDDGDAIPSGNVIDIAGGSNMNTSGSTNVVTINLDDTVSISGSFTAIEDITTTGGNFNMPTTTSDGIEGVFTLGGLPFMMAPGSNNTFLGEEAGDLTITGEGNTGMGSGALAEITLGNSNTCMGYGAGVDNTTGSNNTMMGQAALTDNISGSSNTAIGANALSTLGSGSGAGGNFNVCIGAASASNYGHDESSNIVVGAFVFGTSMESNTIRIGNQGSGDHEQNRCFIAGIVGNTVGSAQLVTIDSATGQLGVSTGSGIAWQTITTDTQLAVNNGYFVNGADTITLTLPVTAAVGDVIEIRVLGTAVNSWIIAQNAGQQVVGNDSGGNTPTVTTVGVTGNVSAFEGNQYFSAISLVCAVTDTIFVANDYVINVEFN